MPENQPKRKNPHELFREIDMICEEVNNSVTQIEQKMEKKTVYIETSVISHLAQQATCWLRPGRK